MDDRASVDGAGFLGKQLETASPALLREMVRTFAEAAMGVDADNVCGVGYGERSDEHTNTNTRTHEQPQRLPETAVGQPGGQHQSAGSKAADRELLPGIAAGPPVPGRAGTDLGWSRRPLCLGSRPGGSRVWSAPWDREAVSQPGEQDGQAPRRRGAGVRAAVDGRQSYSNLWIDVELTRLRGHHVVADSVRVSER